MEHLADEFIRRRRSIAVGRGKRYPEELRKLAVVFATEAEAAGWSGSRIARRLGVAWATVERWCSTRPVAELGGGLMREVVVHDDVPPSAALRPVLVTPGAIGSRVFDRRSWSRSSGHFSDDLEWPCGAGLRPRGAGGFA